MPDFNEIGRLTPQGRARRNVLVGAGIAATGVGRYMRGVYNQYTAPALPPRAEGRLVRAAVKASHELKSFDVNQASTLMNGTYQQFLLNPISQGASALNRTGRKVRAESIRFSALVTTNSAVNFDAVRLTVVMDKECRGAACQQADFLETNANQTYALNSAYDMDNVPSRFKILWDEVIVVNSKVSLSSNVGFVKKNIPISKMIEYYNTSNGNITDIEKGSLYLFASCLETASFSYLAFDSHLFFRDI
jgi:hypothetical protein